MIPAMGGRTLQQRVSLVVRCAGLLAVFLGYPRCSLHQPGRIHSRLQRRAQRSYSQVLDLPQPERLKHLLSLSPGHFEKLMDDATMKVAVPDDLFELLRRICKDMDIPGESW